MQQFFILSFFVASVLTSCKQSANQEQNNEQQPEVVTTTIGKGQAPYLFTDLNKNVYLTWVESINDSSRLNFSTLNKDNQWAETKNISFGSNWFVNWADYPVIATPNGKNMMAHYLTKNGSDTYSYDITIRQSLDSGSNWNDPFLLNEDGKNAEHGFVSILPYNDNFFVTWLDGRNTVSTTSHDDQTSTGAMSLRAAIISPNGIKLNEWELDNRVCDCCQTTAAITKNGPVVVYRDRAENEVRDISIVRLIDNKWTVPITIHDDFWQIMGCPVNGPRMDSNGDQVAVAWFSAANNKPQVNIKFSQDGGATFGKVIHISDSLPIGRVDISLIDGSTAIVSWMENENILAAKVSSNNKIIDRFTIASSSNARSSGFPQMAKSGNQFIFAWTDSNSKTIKTKVLEL